MYNPSNHSSSSHQTDFFFGGLLTKLYKVNKKKEKKEEKKGVNYFSSPKTPPYPFKQYNKSPSPLLFFSLSFYKFIWLMMTYLSFWITVKKTHLFSFAFPLIVHGKGGKKMRFMINFFNWTCMSEARRKFFFFLFFFFLFFFLYFFFKKK